MAKLVSKVYGDALFEAAMEKGNLETIYEESSDLLTVLNENEELIPLLRNPQIVKQEKIAMIHTIFEGRISTDLLGFLALVVEKDRQKELIAIFDYLVNKIREFKRIGTAYITTAVALSESQKEQVKERLLRTTSYVSFDIRYSVQPDLIGGMVIRIGDRVVDSSIKTQIYELKKSLV